MDDTYGSQRVNELRAAYGRKPTGFVEWAALSEPDSDGNRPADRPRDYAFCMVHQFDRNDFEVALTLAERGELEELLVRGIFDLVAAPSVLRQWMRYIGGDRRPRLAALAERYLLKNLKWEMAR